MEIYSFYETIKTSMTLTNDMTIIVASVAIAVVIWLALFVLQGVGICVMAKKQGLKNRALAFLPFVNIWYIGKLAGGCSFFGQRIKRAGMYAMIAQILAALAASLTVAAEQYLWFAYGAPQLATEYGYYYWTGLTGFASYVSSFCNISGYILTIVQLLAYVFMVILMMGLCKKYAPKNYMLLGFLVLFIPVARFIIIFSLRKRQPIDYEAYMRARHEAYMRSQQQYYNGQNPYGNSYGNPYSRPNSPYGQQYGGGAPVSKPEDPFGEFTTGNKGNGNEDPFAEMNGNSDDFFS